MGGYFNLVINLSVAACNSSGTTIQCYPGFSNNFYGSARSSGGTMLSLYTTVFGLCIYMYCSYGCRESTDPRYTFRFVFLSRTKIGPILVDGGGCVCTVVKVAA